MTTEAARLARLGAVLASESRAAILYALLGGTAHTHTELAGHLGLAASTVSEHVGVLLDAGLVEVAAQGRHRYVRLSGTRTAALLEHVGAVAAAPPAGPRVPAALAHARSCYGHLAGRLGVRLHDALQATGAIACTVDGHLTVTAAGRARLTGAGIEVPATTTRPLVRPCLDWSERRDHLAGVVADAVLHRALAAGWFRRHPAQPRVLLVTDRGRDTLARTFEMELP